MVYGVALVALRLRLCLCLGALVLLLLALLARRVSRLARSLQALLAIHAARPVAPRLPLFFGPLPLVLCLSRLDLLLRLVFIHQVAWTAPRVPQGKPLAPWELSITLRALRPVGGGFLAIGVQTADVSVVLAQSVGHAVSSVMNTALSITRAAVAITTTRTRTTSS